MVLDCDENLKSGYSVEVILMPEEEESILHCPTMAICQDEKNTEYVWIIQNGRAVRKDIVTGGSSCLMQWKSAMEFSLQIR